MSDNNVNGKQVRDTRDERTGRFLTGNRGGGRKVGSRNRLGEQFITDLYQEWSNSGAEALKKMATEEPGAFVKVVASILPRELDATLTVEHVELFAQARNFAEAFRLAQRYIGAEPDDPELIEVEADDAD
jgi:hypothetical protein